MKKTKKKMEFSKIILGGIMILFFIISFVGIYIAVFKDTNIYTILCSFVAPSIVTALSTYAWKAKNENIAKIQNNNFNE